MRESRGVPHGALGLNRNVIAALLVFIVAMTIFFTVYIRRNTKENITVAFEYDTQSTSQDSNPKQPDAAAPLRPSASLIPNSIDGGQKQCNQTTVTCNEPTKPFYYPVADAMLNYVESQYKVDSINVKDLAMLMRIMTQIRRDLQSWVSTGKHQDPLTSEAHTNFFERLQKTEVNLYPFLSGKHKTADQWLASYSGRGIVMSGKSSHMRYVAFLLKNLKAVGCNLPVEFVTEDANQLSAEYKALLTELGARVIYLNEVIDNNKAQLGGYGMKLAAMFVSSFREAVLIDCDDVFIRNPELLFDDPGYKATGTLLFYEQPEHLNSYGSRDWLKANLPLPLSERVLNSNMFKGHQREVDSAAVVMDKVRVFYGLLASTRINMRRERDALYPVFWGDAELWWIGFEMAGVLYSISPFSAHSIGPKNGNEVCGKNMHVGNDGRPFFWNQGFVRTKGENNHELLKFEAFAPNGIVVVTSPSLYCVKGFGAIPLNKEELKVADELKQMWINTTGFNHWK